MIPADIAAQLQPNDRVSVPVELLNTVTGLLYDLPARQSMSLILRIQQETELVPEPPTPDAEPDQDHEPEE
ncbi:hypothetical protein ACIQMV_38310 [Streptomyces sp. NPDC091412]|uniref:hypothetical protein n=1 Tax=Streptomyces sp. NPDC091412 TaxID=3366002 RepID=UPI0038081C28